MCVRGRGLFVRGRWGGIRHVLGVSSTHHTWKKHRRGDHGTPSSTNAHAQGGAGTNSLPDYHLRRASYVGVLPWHEIAMPRESLCLPHAPLCSCKPRCVSCSRLRPEGEKTGSAPSRCVGGRGGKGKRGKGGSREMRAGQGGRFQGGSAGVRGLGVGGRQGARSQGVWEEAKGGGKVVGR